MNSGISRGSNSPQGENSENSYYSEERSNFAFGRITTTCEARVRLKLHLKFKDYQNGEGTLKQDLLSVRWWHGPSEPRPPRWFRTRRRRSGAGSRWCACRTWWTAWNSQKAGFFSIRVHDMNVESVGREKDLAPSTCELWQLAAGFFAPQLEPETKIHRLFNLSTAQTNR